MENVDVFNKIVYFMIMLQIEKEERFFLRKNKFSINLFLYNICLLLGKYVINIFYYREDGYYFLMDFFIFSMRRRMLMK